MQDFQQRVVDEKTELDDKKAKLHTFVQGDVFRNLPDTERERLGRQLEIMRMYSDILGERIGAFN